MNIKCKFLLIMVTRDCMQSLKFKSRPSQNKTKQKREKTPYLQEQRVKSHSLYH